MYRKTKDLRVEEKNPLIGILLFITSVALTIVSVPLGLIYGLIYTLLSTRLKGVGDYCLEIAIVVDQQGNVIMQYIFNHLWISGKDKYKFGDRNETISSVLGKNQVNGTLTTFGKFIVRVLDKIDPNHSLNSINYFTERSKVISTAIQLEEIKEKLSVKFPGVNFELLKLK